MKTLTNFYIFFLYFIQEKASFEKKEQIQYRQEAETVDKIFFRKFRDI